MVGFGFGFAAVFCFAEVADFPAFTDLGSSALRAESNLVGHVAGDDAVGVTAFVPLALEFRGEPGVFVVGFVGHDGLLEVLAAFEWGEAQEAFRAFLEEADGLKFFVSGDSEARAIGLEAVAAGFYKLVGGHGICFVDGIYYWIRFNAGIEPVIKQPLLVTMTET